MKIIKLSDSVFEICTTLRKGGVVLYPAETCYGLLARYSDAEAVAKVAQIKTRPQEKKFLVLAENLDKVAEVCEMSDEARVLAEKFWPGALTLVLKIKKSAETLAVRVPAQKLAREILAELGELLISTSANRSGEGEKYDFSEVADLGADLGIDGGIIPKVPPTTLVDCTGDVPRVLRQGQIII